MSEQVEALIYWAVALFIVWGIVSCFEIVRKDDRESAEDQLDRLGRETAESNERIKAARRAAKTGPRRFYD